MPQKVDICFYDALVSTATNYKCEITFYSMRPLIVGWYLLSHLLNKDTDDLNVYNLITTLFLVIIAFNLVNVLFSSWVFKNIIMNGRLIN